MAKITIKEPEGPYSAILDTDVMNVEISGAYLGIKFISEDGKTLSVSERDGDFEIIRGTK